ncbi:hypothetical protein GF362_03510 [Candidatus Dojkabacteria bacterium]|nr:hypothetical protein [Candidatus Dojkabacteria bacterium]
MLHQNRIEVFRYKRDRQYKIWESEDDIKKIDKVLLFDHDNDGKKELLVVYWRYGDYLGERPFLKPIVGDESLSQHINIYELEPYIHLKWGSSSLPKPIINLQICKEDTSVLCAGESTYEEFPTIIKNIKLEWNGWWWEKD